MELALPIERCFKVVCIVRIRETGGWYNVEPQKNRCYKNTIINEISHRAGINMLRYVSVTKKKTGSSSTTDTTTDTSGSCTVSVNDVSNSSKRVAVPVVLVGLVENIEKKGKEFACSRR